VAAGGALSAQEAARLAQEAAERERMRRDLEVDKDRRHQVDLLTLQNEVNAAALGAQARVAGSIAAAVAGVAVEEKRCAQGHPARAGDRFCASCGAALQD